MALAAKLWSFFARFDSGWLRSIAALIQIAPNERPLPQIQAETGHVVLVLMGHDQEIDVALAVDRRQQRLQIGDGGR